MILALMKLAYHIYYFLKYFVTFGTLGSFITIYFNPALFTNEQGNTS
jgi:hypothetical protein